MGQRSIIGSRGSKLALWQAEWVRDQLREAWPGSEIEIKVIKTTGDANQTSSLSLIGGQGVFTKELETALLRNEIDLAVHSLKDLPSILPDDLSIAAICEREDPRDALIARNGVTVSGDSLDHLPKGATVGTSSPRRAAQLRALRPDLMIKDLRGNIDSRLRKLDAGEYDFIILACAGLRRMGWIDRITFAIDPDEMLPAVGQGALGIETRFGDVATNDRLSVLDHAETRSACLAERSFLRTAGGGCLLPLTAHAVVSDKDLRLDGLIVDESGTMSRRKLTGSVDEAEAIGVQLAREMLATR